MSMRIARGLSAIFVVGLLGACAGGNPEIRLTPETMDTWINSSTIFVRANGEVQRFPYVCFADICSRSNRAGTGAIHYTDESLRFIGIHDEPDEEPLRRNGFDLAAIQEEYRTHHFLGYGAWGRFVAFDVGIVNVFPEGRDPYQYTEATLGGVGSRSNPSPAGGASWSGVMVGADYGDPHAQQFVQGDARVTVDFEESDVEVALSDIIRVDGTGIYDDMTWTDLPMRGGRFASPSIDGQFFGNGHQEVGGVFDRNGIVGAFGATRERD